MIRDNSKFPDDENGDALWGMAVEGDDLSKERDIEFTVIFKAEDMAMKFGEHLLFNRQQVLLCDDEDSEEYPFYIVATAAMVPTYEAITEYETLLAEFARDLNGINDGWGCDVQT